MVYKILKVIVRWCLKLSFKKIYIHGKEHLKDGPYFLACNHPAGFMEPLLLACFLDRELHWLVRGDLFKNPFLKPLLVSTNQIPIFRVRDGFSNLRNNTQVMSRVSEVLLEGVAITIFIEGSTKMVKHLRPLQKGMARMALRTLSHSSEQDIKILPIGMCFTETTQLREEVVIAIGPPLSAESYLADYEKDKAGAIQRLTDDTYTAMKHCMVELIPEREELFDRLGRIWRSTLKLPFWPVEVMDASRFKNEQNLAHGINALTEDQVNSISKEAGAWLDQYQSIPSTANPILSILGMVGWIGNFIPVRLGKWFADTVIESPEFYATIRMVATLVSFIVYYIGWLMFIIFNPVYFWLPIVFILLGITYLYRCHKKEENKKGNIDDEMKAKRETILRNVIIEN